MAGNKGAYPGLTKGAIYTHIPKIVALVHSGGAAPTQPSLGNSVVWGEYGYTPLGNTVYNFGITFGSTATFGSGDDFWGFSLPVPVDKYVGSSINPEGYVLLKQGTLDNPMYTLSALATNLEGSFTPFAQQTDVENWFSIAAVNPQASGTGTITNATPATITHVLGMTPSAWDIKINPTSLTAGSANPGLIYVDTITSTQFNVNTSTALGASKSLGFSWRADCMPSGAAGDYFPANVGSKKPWFWAAGHSISGSIVYRSKG